MKYIVTSLFALCVGVSSSFGQVTVTTFNSPVSFDFSTYTGLGFSSTGAAGFLDSRNWRVFNLFVQDTTIQGTSFDEDRVSSGNRYGRGVGGGNGSAGLWAMDVGNESGPTNIGLGFAPNRNNTPDPDTFILNSGGVELRLQNKTGSTITALNFIYDVFVFNDKNSEYKLDFYVDGVVQNSASLTTPDGRDGTSANTDWVQNNRSGSVNGLNWTTDSVLIFRWEGPSVDILDTAIDEIAIDNIMITAVPEPSIYALAVGGLALGMVIYLRKRQRA